MIIHNFAEYLRAHFPAETIYVNGRRKINKADIPHRNVLLRSGSGPDQPLTGFGYQMIQCIARDKEGPEAEALAWEIYEYVYGRFGQILPAAIVKGVLHPEIQTGQMSATSRPQLLGEDEDGRMEFVTNFQIYWRRT